MLRAWWQQHPARKKSKETQALAAVMNEFVQDRKVTISITETDCDHCTGTRIHTMGAKPHRVLKFINRVCDDAEGPVYWVFVHPQDVQQARDAAVDSFHDGILEASENGHAFCVYR